MSTTAKSNAGTVKYLPSAGLVIVNYPATAHPDSKFTIDPVTGYGALHNIRTGDGIIDDALVSLTWHEDTKTKQASASYPLPGGDTDLSRYNQLSADFPGQMFAFEVPDPGNPTRKRLAVGCGVTPVGSGVSKASMTVVSKDFLGGYPVREAENAPITNYRPPQTANGVSEESVGYLGSGTFCCDGDSGWLVLMQFCYARPILNRLSSWHDSEPLVSL